jgi:hypothetical protein
VQVDILTFLAFDCLVYLYFLKLLSSMAAECKECWHEPKASRQHLYNFFALLRSHLKLGGAKLRFIGRVCQSEQIISALPLSLIYCLI